MKRLIIGLSVVLLSACTTFKSPEIDSYDGISGFKIKPGEIQFTVNAGVLNANNKKIKIHPSKVNVFIQHKKIAEISNAEKITLKRNGVSKVSVPIVAETEKGTLIRLTTLSFKDSVNIQFVGEITAGLGIFKKTIPINESLKSSTRFLKLKN